MIKKLKKSIDREVMDQHVLLEFSRQLISWATNF